MATNANGSTKSPFNEYAMTMGYSKLKDLPGSIGKQLSATPEKVAPNSPMLAELAKHMGAPLEDLQAFAKGPRMTDRFLKKITKQIERGTIPRGAKHAAQMRQNAAKRTAKHAVKTRGAASPTNAFSKFTEEHGVPITTLAKKLVINKAMAWKLSAGHLARNHPMLTLVASILDVPVEKVRAFQHGKPLTDGRLANAEKAYAVAPGSRKSHDHTPSKAVVLHVGKPIEIGGKANGKARSYNKLKGLDVDVREATRTLVATVNYNIMQGETMAPPIALHDLYLVLADYLEEKGIRENVMVDPKFVQLFDRK